MMWIPAPAGCCLNIAMAGRFAGRTKKMMWIPACAGMTEKVGYDFEKIGMKTSSKELKNIPTIFPFAPIAVFVVSLFFRLIYLTRVPIGFASDELDFVLNAKSFFYFLHGFIFTQLSPVTITKTFPFAELQSIVFAPFIGLLPFSVLAARLPHAIMGSIFCVLLYLITEKLIDKKYALVVGILAAVSPWGIFFSRLTYDTSFSAFFLVLGLYMTLHLKSWKILWLLVPYFLAFHGYLGMMTLFVPYIGVLAWYGYKHVNDSKYAKQYIIVLCISMLFVVRYAWVIMHQTGNRTAEVFSPNSVSLEVDRQRKESMSSPAVSLYVNKPTVYLETALSKYLNAFSPEILFLRGDPKYHFSLFYHGFFFYGDIILIPLGWLILYTKYRRQWTLLTLLTLIAPIPSVVSNLTLSYASRSYMLLPVFIIFAGVGLVSIIERVQKTKLRYLVIGGLFLLYVWQIGNFYSIYFFRNPIYNSEGMFFSGRLLSTVIKKELSIHPNIIVVSSSPQTEVRQYLFYQTKGTKQDLSSVIASYDSDKQTIGGVTFMKCPLDLSVLDGKAVIIEAGVACVKPYVDTYHPVDSFQIGMLRDAGTLYRAYGFGMCDPQLLPRFPMGMTLGDLSLDTIDTNRLCKTLLFRN
jgi:hypothetical protein